MLRKLREEEWLPMGNRGIMFERTQQSEERVMPRKDDEPIFVNFLSWAASLLVTFLDEQKSNK